VCLGVARGGLAARLSIGDGKRCNLRKVVTSQGAWWGG